MGNQNIASADEELDLYLYTEYDVAWQEYEENETWNVYEMESELEAEETVEI